ncbi:ABC transporter substrate-binding protein [Agromyces atrinae]|uniref:Peptide/nickel transport system substrate-binding protein n=1 Tax=Agromyces atrinae TaxID=592376 RepID=A0A4Q2MDA3_9MICO|nr:ABC transporter substrate-binding protein [Agromyces atrinae]NYD67692.1 peptide/nickel transport system substrate-binding protein [Agromyces atrinae]RXZ88111.1 hypothetical protein ESP50_02695 [Agromyces atrinae]
MRDQVSRPAVRVTLAALLTLAVAAGGAACATSDVASTEQAAVYRMPITDPASEIDPLTAADQSAMAITGLVTEPLVSLTRDGELMPRLAVDWTASDDGLVWTIELRPDARFNDGSPVTAADVVSTFDALIADDSVSPGHGAFVGIVESVAVGDEDSVEFTLSRPFSDLPILFTGTNTGILPADYEVGSWLENPIGAGQFLLEDYTIGVGATYVANPDYWNADAIELDGVELKIYDDFAASVLAFQADEIDRIGLTVESASTIDVSQYETISSGYNRFDGIFLDVTAPPFDDVAVREALAWAIDREALVANVYEGNADVANDTTFFPDYSPQPSGLVQREQDLEMVAELLGGRTPSFTLTTANQLLGEVLQQQLNAVPGFEVGLEVLSTEQYFADGEASPWLTAPVTVTNWAKRVPSQYVSLVYGAGAPWNASHYANPALEELTAQFDATTDAVARQELADRIAHVQWSDVPVVIPAYSKSQALQNPRVKGEFIGAIDFYTGYNFAGISIEP